MPPFWLPGFRSGPSISSEPGIVIYLLDTSAISALMREDTGMAFWLSTAGSEDRVVTCTIARGEILFGIERLASGRRRTDLEAKATRVLAALPCEPVPSAAGDLYAIVKKAQQRRGLPLDENDFWIAATALALSATLVTNDSDFQSVETLAVVQP
jgi:predicted nucleic acid-binding protein